MIVNVIKASSTPPTGGSRGLWTSSQNDFLSDFNKCVITGSDTAKSCQIIYVTELSLPLHGIIPGYYLTQENDALKKKCQEIWYMGGGGGGGGGRGVKAQLANL